MSEESWIGQDGSFGDLATAPDNVKDLVSKKGYKSVGDIADAYNSAATKLGHDPAKLVVWDENDLSPIHERLGRPKTAAEYNLDFKSDVLDDTLIQGFKDHAHKLGLNGKQFNDVVKFQVDAMTTAMEVQQKDADDAAADLAKSQAEVLTALKDRRGIKDDATLQEAIGKAKKVAEDTGLYKTLEAKGLMDDLEVVDSLIGLSERVADNVLPKGGAGADPTSEQQIDAIVNDPAFTDRMHPDHKGIMEKFNKLHGF